jgi:hypothetical protein
VPSEDEPDVQRAVADGSSVGKGPAGMLQLPALRRRLPRLRHLALAIVVSLERCSEPLHLPGHSGGKGLALGGLPLLPRVGLELMRSSSTTTPAAPCALGSLHALARRKTLKQPEKDIEAMSSNFAPTTVATAVAGAIPNSRGAWGGRRLYCDNGAPKVESRMFIAANGSSVVAKARAVVGAKMLLSCV